MNNLLDLLVTVLIWGCIFWVLWWALNAINPPEPWKKIGTVILVVATVVVLLNLLGGFTGHSFLRLR